MCEFVSKEKFPIGTKTKVVAFIFLLSINSKRKRHKQSSTYCSKSEPQIAYVAHITQPVKGTP